VKRSKNLLNLKSCKIILWEPSFKTRRYVAEACYPLYSKQLDDTQYLLNKIRSFSQSSSTRSYVQSLSSNFSSTLSKCCKTPRLLISHNSDVVWLRPFHEAYKTEMFFIFRLIHQISPSRACAMLEFKKQAEVLPYSPVDTRGLWWAYPLRNKAPRPQIEIWSCKTVVFVQILECQAPLHKRKAPL